MELRIPKNYKERYKQNMASYLEKVGRQVLKTAVERYDAHTHSRPGKVTGNLRDSIAFGVYVDHKLTAFGAPSPEATKAKKWNGKELYGNSYAYQILSSHKPKAQVALVLIAAMPYRKFLEGKPREASNGADLGGYVVVSDMWEDLQEAASHIKVGNRVMGKVTFINQWGAGKVNLG